MLNVQQKAIKVLKTTRYKKYLASLGATQSKSRLYTPGEIVVDIDPKYRYGESRNPKLKVFVSSIKWPGGGGYIVVGKKGTLHTTTNIQKRGKKSRYPEYTKLAEKAEKSAKLKLLK